MTRGSVVLVPFPFDDLSGAKVRPAVSLTEPIGPHRHVVPAFLNSQVPGEPLDSDLVLFPGMPGFEATGLRVPSALRLHRLLTVSTSSIARKLGARPADLMREVEDRLRRLFGSG